MAADIYDDILGRAKTEHPAILGPDYLTYSALLARADRIARMLGRLTGSGRVVASCLPHGPNTAGILLAARIAGKVLVPINPKVSGAELDHIVNDCGASLIVTATGTPVLDLPGEADVELGIVAYQNTVQHQPQLSSDDAIIIYTSGSTGPPKGVVHTTHSLSANVIAVAEYLAIDPSDRLATFTPPSFAYSVNQTLTHLWAGAAVLPWAKGMFEPLDLLEAHAQLGLTGIQANPSILSVLCRVGADSGISLPAIRYVQSGGQPLSASLVNDLRMLCPEASVINMYGCTENGPRITFKKVPEVVTPGSEVSVGKAVRGTRLAILGEAGDAVPPGTVGEIAVAGTSLMRTYLGMPNLMAERMSGEWFRTRDLGFIDETGDLHLQGRVDNVILVGHEKVSPEEVEGVLLAVPGISDIAVGALPDPLLYQTVGALVVVAGGHEQALQEARRTAREKLSRAKAPRRYFVVDGIPKTPYGKIDRRAVAALLQLEAGRAAALDH
jgi:long-chain acyl-CoA synthetase